MDIIIKQKKENSLLGRTELNGLVVFEGATPSNVQVTEMIAQKLGVDAQRIVLQHIFNRFGYQEARFNALAYASKETQDKFQIVLSHVKKKAKAASKAESPAKP